MRTWLLASFSGAIVAAAGCSSASSNDDGPTTSGASTTHTTADASSSGTADASSSGAGARGPASSSSGHATSSGTGQGAGGQGGGASGTGGAGGAGQGGAGGADTGGHTLESDRDRLLETYFRYLEANATTPQSNGLSSSNVSSKCDVWSQLDPSSRAVFLTITARLGGSILGQDGSSMLSHVTKLYRIAGGQGATQTDPGSCGGGEYNRLIMSMDAELQSAQVAANTNLGALASNGRYDIADQPTGTFWRDSHDLGGSHAPFDSSDETDTGAPRGQTQYFSSPSSALANMPLGRVDLMTLVDPYALEMDQDYDCPHNSNPSCSYTTYGSFCIPHSSKLGTQIYTDNYGDFDANWTPSGCP